MIDDDEFDVCGPLPKGVTVLEASAGTGKTYAIASLAARYVAEGARLERILLVTFTRIATGELRERVRLRLLEVRDGLLAALAVPGASIADEVVRLLAGDGAEEARARIRRLTRALASFDAATILTIHGFCGEVLGGLGIAVDLEPEFEFAEDLGDLMEEVLDDFYVRRFLAEPAGDFTRAKALQVARIAAGNPDAPLAPASGSDGEMRVRLAARLRTELDARKHRLAVMSYDDLLERLDSALAGANGPATAARMRDAYDIVLVDEFQDTDPVQWRIMRRAFAETGATVVLIADPKQAIYSFRGADVYAYLAAARTAGTRKTLSVNHRSDQDLLDAFDALFSGVRLGDEEIVYRQVRASEGHAGSRLVDAPDPAPLRFRTVQREDVGLTARGWASQGAATEHVAHDLAAEIVRLLASDASISGRADGKLTPGDIAVLVPFHFHAAIVSDALEEVGVPAVTAGAGSVFATPSAQAWLTLLEALERPSSTVRAHGVALTPFFGWTAAEVAAADDARWEALHARLHGLARVLRTTGVASLFDALNTHEDLPGRWLAHTGGERALTDIRHLGQLLHAAERDEDLGLSALAGWLRHRISEGEGAVPEEDRSRRLESDARAVQILTIHRSKGLEFPIVMLPYLWHMGRFRSGEPVSFHDPDADGRRTLDVAVGEPRFSQHEELALAEKRGEDLRLLYVALTRARHQAVVWWAGTYNSRDSPLHRLLFERRDDGSVASHGVSAPTDAEAEERLRELAATAASGRIAVQPARQTGLPAIWSGALEPPGELDVARFERRLDLGWRRTSYSDITAPAHDWAQQPRAIVGSEVEATDRTDEPETPAAGEPPPDDAPPSPLAATPGGTALGTIVHAALELADFAAVDLEAELTAALAAARRWRTADLGDPLTLVRGLAGALRTPLGTDLQGLRLADIRREDRLDELAFELPLAGGDHPRGVLTPGLVATVLEDGLPAGDPMRAYATRLRSDPLRSRVRGYLTGFLDLVARIPGPSGDRYLIVDYKTNRLAAADEPLTLWHYRAAALGAEMEQSHYILQALLYTVALHRYLRWRLTDYDPDRDLAGVAYAFLRGMNGGAGEGVVHLRPRGALVTALSDALDRGAEPA